MRTEVHCEHCEHLFTPSDKLAGGLGNCPHCGKATSIPGLRDPLWRLIQVAILFGSLLLGGLAYQSQGIAWGAGVTLALLGLGWLVTRVF